MDAGNTTQNNPAPTLPGTTVPVAEAESLLAAIVASSYDPIISKTLCGIVTSWNESAARLLGYTAEEMVGHSIRRIIPADRQSEEDVILARIRSGETIRSFETVRITKDGRPVYVSITASPIRDRDGKIIGASKILRDISQLRHLLHEAREREQRFQGIFNATFQYIGLLSTDGTVLEVNRTALEVVGAKASDAIGLPFWLTPWWAHYPEEQERIKDAVRRAASGEFVRFEAKYLPLNGKESIVDFSMSPVKDEDGNITLLVPEGHDITELKRAERDLEESRQRQLQILNNSLAFMCLLDDQARIVEVNSAAQRVSGVSHADLIGQVFQDSPWWQHSDDVKSQINDAVRRCLRGETVRCDLQYLAIGGELRWVDFQAAPLFDSFGRIIGVVPSGVDITDRKLAEERSKLLMNEVNHRAKNILGVVNAIARQTTAATNEEFVARFSARVRALAANQDLLVRGNWHSVEITALLKSQLGHFANSIGTRITFDGPSCRIRSEAAQSLGMAIYELATNAGKYGALANDSGHIRLAWSITGTRFKISWTETGGPPIATAPSRRGFGRTVVEVMTKMSLAAEVSLSYAPEGLIWQLDGPIERIVETSANHAFRF